MPKCVMTSSGNGNLRKSRPGSHIAHFPTQSAGSLQVSNPVGRSAGKAGDAPEELPILEISMWACVSENNEPPGVRQDILTQRWKETKVGRDNKSNNKHVGWIIRFNKG